MPPGDAADSLARAGAVNRIARPSAPECRLAVGRLAAALMLTCVLLPLTPAARAQTAGLDGFRRDVAPLLSARCLACHNAESHKGGLDLSRRATALAGGDSGPALEAGQPDASLLIERVTDGSMPPTRDRLTPAEVAALRTWVEAEAPYEGEPLAARRAGLDWWSLQPLRRPTPPAVVDAAWPRTPLDAFLLARLDAEHLTPAPEADRRTLIRRLTFDLTGLPPTAEQVDAFAADDRPDAYERLVDRLLASPHHGERWGRHWLDVVRFAESQGYETNLPRPNAWPYRDWVIRAFNADLPFERFVAEQLAGDQLADGDWLTQAGTGFLVGGTHDIVGNQTVEGSRQQRADDLDDMITAVGTAFLGLSVQCARCHDHKFDPIPQADYYGMKALLSGVDHAERDLPAPGALERRRERQAALAELADLDARLDALETLARPDLGAPGRGPVTARRNVERFEPTPARFVRFTVQATVGSSEPCLDELEVWSAGASPRNLALAEGGANPLASSTYPNSEIHRLEHLNDGRVGNARSWISGVPGKGWVQVELPELVMIDRVVWGRDREERFADRLATEYYVEVAAEPGQWRVVASSADRTPYREGAPTGEPAGLSPEQSADRASRIERQKALRARVATLNDTVKVYTGSFRTPDRVPILRRGDVMQEGPEAVPAALRSLSPRLELPADATDAERRLALARWIGDPANPLPARVAVNRVWMHHFGRGLVETPGDFGFQGAPPTHPELLDWLATEFRDGGGRAKPLHRQILLSAAYRQASRPDPDALARDGNSRLLWRMPPRRLEAEPLRDAIVAVSGRLDTRMGGPGYSLWEPNTNYVAVFNPLRDLGPDADRRMVYQYKPRSQPDPTFGAFDCPEAAQVVPKRNLSTTALQSLNLLNSRFILDHARTLSVRLEREAGPDPEAQVRYAFRLAFGRLPTDAELRAATGLIRTHGVDAFGRALFNANEFLYVD